MSSGGKYDELSEREKEHYARHISLEEVGEAGQLKLKSSSVLVVGVGGLGCPAALYLASAGVGRIGLVDPDVVSRSNLQRQVLYTDKDVGKPKTEVAAERLRQMNPHIAVDAYGIRVNSHNVEALLSQFDLVVDGSDNFATRYLLNDACVLLRKKLVLGSVSSFQGQVAVYEPGNSGGCYRCLFPPNKKQDEAPRCEGAGVLGVVPGLVGVWQAAEANKLLLEVGASLSTSLVSIDVASGRVQKFARKEDPQCEVCRARDGGYTLERWLEEHGESLPSVVPVELSKKLAEPVSPLLLDVREEHEREIAKLPGLWIPLHEIPKRHQELDPRADYVVYCHHGMRSAMAAKYLKSVGFERVTNLTGGIDAWSQTVDSSISRY